MLIADKAEYDPSGNFGRLARVPGLMGEFVVRARSDRALGIPIQNWIAFLKQHSDTSDPDQVHAALLASLKRKSRRGSVERASRVMEALDLLGDALANGA